ncbi:MAG TPA: group III truncated hemoglobin [Saprospiraceae bacterium]|nr:group III truncated hemoglobin [Saprospiraceae bacterium]
MKDISTVEDIKSLIDSFYSKVKKDDVIGYIFNDVAHVNWEHHLPKMYAFWEFLLLGMDTYRGNPFEAHRKLSEKIQLRPDHFDRWLQLFTQSVDEQFAGLNAEEAKNKAKLIAMTWVPKFSE